MLLTFVGGVLPGIEASVFSSLQSRSVTGALFLILLILFQVLECTESYVHIRALPPPTSPLRSFLYLISVCLFLFNIYSRRNFFLKERLFFQISFSSPISSTKSFHFFLTLPLFFRNCSMVYFPFYRHVSLPSAA